MKRGFTLVEVLIYSAVGTALLIVMSVSIVSLQRSFQMIQTDFVVNQSVSSVFETLSREIRGATSVDTVNSVLGRDVGVLSLNKIDRSGQNNKSNFILSDGILYYQKGSEERVALNRKEAPITRFTLNALTSPHSYAVKIDLAILHFKDKATTTENFSTTYILRGSY